MNLELEKKIADYNNFAKLLLMLSGFFVMGLAVQWEGKTMTQLGTMMGSVVVFLGGSVILFLKVKKLQDKLCEES